MNMNYAGQTSVLYILEKYEDLLANYCQLGQLRKYEEI